MLKALASITARLAVAFGLLVVFHDSCMCSIQEVAASPVQSLGGALASGDPQLEQLALEANLASDQPLDQGTAPAEFEQAQLGGGGTSPPQPTGAAVAREYVWGPGDRGLDELLAQFDAAREPLVVLQDAGLDALAACDLNGVGPGGEPGAARVAAQYAFDPYGRVISNENLLTHGYLRVGHKGLFVDRLDEGLFTGAGAERPRLKAGARVQYQVRNRVLDPELGRWLQSDPNATGLVVVSRFAYGGLGIGSRVDALNLGAHHADGPNMYEYVGSNAWTHSDPLGLLIGLFPTLTVQESMYAAESGAKLGLTETMRVQMIGLMARYYAHMVVGMEAAYGAATGLPDSPFGLAGAEVGLMLARTVENMGGRTGPLLEMAGRNFRANLETVTSFSGRIYGHTLHAHHIIPQQFADDLARLGVNIHNPIFGQWVDAETHAAIHAGGRYNKRWETFVRQLQQEGVEGDEAYRRVIRFIQEITDEYGDLFMTNAMVPLLSARLAETLDLSPFPDLVLRPIPVFDDPIEPVPELGDPEPEDSPEAGP